MQQYGYYLNQYPQQMYPQPMPDQLAQLRQSQYQPQMNTQGQQQSGMVWVRNRYEAENYPVAPNTAIALWDTSGPYVHRKETDVSGRPMVKTFRLVEVTDAQKTDAPQPGEYITRQEFEEFVKSLTYQAKYTPKEEAVNE